MAMDLCQLHKIVAHLDKSKLTISGDVPPKRLLELNISLFFTEVTEEGIAPSS